MLAATEPLQPLAPTIALQTSTSIGIRWIEPDDGGAEVTDYVVKVCVGQDPGCSFSVSTSSTGGLTNYELSGLTKGTYYQFKVHAINVVGPGPDSPTVTIVAANVPNTMLAPTRIAAQTSRT